MCGFVSETKRVIRCQTYWSCYHLAANSVSFNAMRASAQRLDSELVPRKRRISYVNNVRFPVDYHDSRLARKHQFTSTRTNGLLLRPKQLQCHNNGPLLLTMQADPYASWAEAYSDVA
jgi:hypothetical protein